MAGLNSFPSLGITPGNLNYLKYCFALTYYGKIVFKEIFTWGFKEPHSEIKKSLFKLPNYSNSRFRSDFDQSQRSKIENGCIAEFDLSLFYLLIQRLCPLDGASDKLWSKDGDAERLPAILYNIKLKRNLSTHNCQAEITEQELKLAVNELIDLFNKALLAAGKEFCISSKIINIVIRKIVHHLESIVESSSCETKLLPKKFVKENKVKTVLVWSAFLLTIYSIVNWENGLQSWITNAASKFFKFFDSKFLGKSRVSSVNTTFEQWSPKFRDKDFYQGFSTMDGRSSTYSRSELAEHATRDFVLKAAVQKNFILQEEFDIWAKGLELYHLTTEKLNNTT